MMAGKSQECLKSSLSQTLLQTLNKLDDPKYATVPICHCNEMRPSILEQYQCKNSKNANDYATKSSRSIQAGNSSSRLNHQSKPLLMRALSWSVESFWRYCASKIHIEFEHSKRKSENKSKKNTDQQSARHQDSLTQATVTSSTGGHHALHTKGSQHEEELHGQCSRPAFEVLPTLYESCTHTLLYQNAYLLDGVKYDYGPNRTNHERCVSTRLRLNYLKFLKSVCKTSKPTDCEVVFGEAKVIVNPEPHWEGSRLDWLLNLEKQCELRKQKYLEAENMLKISEESNERFTKGLNKKIPLMKEKNKIKKCKRKEKRTGMIGHGQKKALVHES